MFFTYDKNVSKMFQKYFKKPLENIPERQGKIKIKLLTKFYLN